MQVGEIDSTNSALDVEAIDCHQNLFSNCIDSLIISNNTIPSYVYSANVILISDVQITTASTRYAADSMVCLIASFEVMPQANFVAEIDACP